MNFGTNGTGGAAGPAPDRDRDLFQTFFMAGFECSTHRVKTGRRLDMIAATRHDEFCGQDYERLIGQGIRTAREGLRWHLIEQQPGVYDFSSVLPMVNAGRQHGIQILWDLCHYGWPDHLDIFTPEFVHSFGRFAKAFASWLFDELPGIPFITPMNEISFFSWAGGDAAYLNPLTRNRGLELKAQLVRAAIEAMNAFQSVTPDVRFLQIDPIIHIVAHPNRPRHRKPAERYRTSMFQAWDMIGGRYWPQLGGDPRYLDIIGVNFYPDNQWIHKMEILRRGHPLYRPLREILQEVHERYRRPMLISETGCEDEARPSWLNYICQEVEAAMANGVPIFGVCLYPIVNHPGWDNYRHCHNGLWDYADDLGHREIYAPLAEEMQRWRKVFEAPAALADEPRKAIGG